MHAHSGQQVFVRHMSASRVRDSPPRWPHFFSEDSWSSKCTPAAPASIMAFIISYAFSGPPKPASASATMGAYLRQDFRKSSAFRSKVCAWAERLQSLLSQTQQQDDGNKPGVRICAPVLRDATLRDLNLVCPPQRLRKVVKGGSAGCSLSQRKWRNAVTFQDCSWQIEDQGASCRGACCQHTHHETAFRRLPHTLLSLRTSSGTALAGYSDWSGYTSPAVLASPATCHPLQ